MKYLVIPLLCLPLSLAGCGEQSAPSTPASAAEPGAAVQESTEQRLKREGGEWMKETKELGSAAWDATKEKSAEYSKKAGEYYDATKEKSKVYYESAKREGSELYEQAKRDGAELYEQAKEKGAEVYEGAKADMEARDGHPPAMEPAR